MQPELQLPVSALGTKSYWDDLYDNEIDNFSQHGDSGEVWFGAGITRKVVNWIVKTCGDTDRTAHIMDLGCGNGHTLMLLHQKGFRNLTGIDYSDQAIVLARKIAEKGNAGIQFHVADILLQHESIPCSSQSDFLMDKGTFDAICLNPAAAASITHSREQYVAFVKQNLKAAGFFIITSCNWTKDELENHFADHFVLMDEIASPTLTFGGKQGNRVTTLIWQQRSPSK